MAKKNKSDYTIGVDLGGTKILAAVVDENGVVIGSAKKRTQSEDGPDAVLKRIVKTMQEAVEMSGVNLSDVKAIGLGAPGVIDMETATVVSATNMPGWKNIEVGKVLRQWHNVPVWLSNDVRVATFGEQLVGAGRGVKNFVAIFVGTGIGGGIVIDGKIYVGGRGSAGEIGPYDRAGRWAILPWAAVCAAASRQLPAMQPWSAICAWRWLTVVNPSCRHSCPIST